MSEERKISALGGGLFFILTLALSSSILFALIIGLIGSRLVRRFMTNSKALALDGPAKEQVGGPRIRVSISESEEDMLKKMDQAYKDLMDMREAANKAKAHDIRDQGLRLYETGVKIFQHLDKNPRKIRMANRYFNYYLGTASKILNKYIDFAQMGIDSLEVNEVYEQTQRALEILNGAFERQFLKLMKNDKMEIEASVKVLESIYESEDGGLNG